jgi:hypothetical protein
MEKGKLILYIFLLAALLISCSRKNNGTQAGKDYCSCLLENNSAKDFFYAATICNAEMIKKYRLYRIYKLDSEHQSFRPKMSEGTKDSMNKFVHDFYMHIYTNCLKVDSTKVDSTKK